ncbi:unnamed protein product [Prunus brigantina]
MGGEGRRSRAGHFGTGLDPNGGRMKKRPAKMWPAVCCRREREGGDARERERERESDRAILSFYQKSNFEIFTILPLSSFAYNSLVSTPIRAHYVSTNSSPRALRNGTIGFPKFIPDKNDQITPVSRAIS